MEFQADFSRASGYVPVIQSVNEDEVYAKFLEKADGGKVLLRGEEVRKGWIF